jgi:hypothetical protein
VLHEVVGEQVAESVDVVRADPLVHLRQRVRVIHVSLLGFGPPWSGYRKTIRCDRSITSFIDQHGSGVLLCSGSSRSSRSGCRCG